MASMAGIEYRDLRKHYWVDGRQVEVLRGLDLTLPEHRITVVLGRSGCGKTTLLRLTGGLEQPDGGVILRGDRRKTAIVFQEPRLMPWLRVWDNVTFGLERQDIREETIRELLELVGLSGFQAAYPHQLSGGMQQRCAIARALACEPDFLMMDEPFAALDHFTREQLQQELKRLQARRKLGILFVTHSLDEALLLGHRIVVLQQGRVHSTYEVPEGDRNLLDPALIEMKRNLIQDLKEREGI